MARLLTTGTRIATALRAGSRNATALRPKNRGATALRTMTVDAAEIARFSRLAREWHDAEGGAFRALHSMNELRVPWIESVVGEERTEKKEEEKERRGGGGIKQFFNVSQSTAAVARPPKRVCEIGCGGGVLSVALARRGLHVTGVDAGAEAVKAAESMKQWMSIDNETRTRMNFENGTAEEFAERHPGKFDAVVASEVIEHVHAPWAFVEACAQLVKPGGSLFFTTINRTVASRVLAVWMAEKVLGIVPDGMHDWNKFVQPEELDTLLRRVRCRTEGIYGMAYEPMSNRWEWTTTQAINYALVARKESSE